MKNDGGPAFPGGLRADRQEASDDMYALGHGMSLHQWYVGQALKGFIVAASDEEVANVLDKEAQDMGLTSHGILAKLAIESADEVIRQLNEREENGQSDEKG